MSKTESVTIKETDPKKGAEKIKAQLENVGFPGEASGSIADKMAKLSGPEGLKITIIQR